MLASPARRCRKRPQPRRHRASSRTAAAPAGQRRHRAAGDRGRGAASRATAAPSQDAGRHGPTRETPAAPPQTPTQVVAGQNDQVRRGPRSIVAPIGANSYSDQSPGDRGAAARRQYDARQGVVADPGRIAELGRQRRTACAQRARQPSVPHQRHHAPRRRRRFRPNPRHRHRRQSCPFTGALPAQYGLRTAGVLDIQTKTDAFNNSGSVSVYGGSHGTITTSLEYGGTVGQTQYFVSGRYFGSNLGIENPTSSNEAIHDRTGTGERFSRTFRP